MKIKSAGLIMATVLFMFSVLFITACQKGSIGESSSQAIAVYLTDAPDRFSAVNIDLQYVEVKVDTCAGRKDQDHAGGNDSDADDHHRGRDEFGNWDTLSFNPGIYNVAALRNGIDTLLATGVVNGRIRKIRLTLGTGSTVTVDGTDYPLLLPAGASPYLYVKIQDKHRGHDSTGEQQIWVDFDISRSISERNGQYYLVPRLKPFCDANSGTLSGVVLPAEAGATVTAYSSADTATTIAEKDGRFKLRGLQPGSYTVVYDGIEPYRDTTVTGVSVSAGRPVKLPAVTLIK